MSRIRVLLVDANDDFLDSLSAWIQRCPRLQVVGRAHSGSEAIERTGRLLPDLLLMDAALPDLNGFEVTRRIKSRPDAPLIVLMVFHGSRAARERALAAGADECMSKTETTEWLLPELEKLLPSSLLDEVAKEVGKSDALRAQLPLPGDEAATRRAAHVKRRKNP